MAYKTVGISALFAMGLSGAVLAEEPGSDCSSFAWPYIPVECLSFNVDELERDAARFAIANPKPHQTRRRGHLQQLLQKSDGMLKARQLEMDKATVSTGNLKTPPPEWAEQKELFDVPSGLGDG